MRKSRVLFFWGVFVCGVFVAGCSGGDESSPSTEQGVQSASPSGLGTVPPPPPAQPGMQPAGTQPVAAQPATGQADNPAQPTATTPGSTLQPPTNGLPGNGLPPSGTEPSPNAVGNDPAGTPAGACDEPGLPMDGTLMYSPGGDVLPHPCEPFHPTHNNPFAVKCVEAWPWYDSGYPGDELCILPPEPGKGIQVGIHPQGLDWYDQVSQGDLSGYQNVSESYLIPVRGEAERNYRTKAGNAEPFNFYRSATRMRSGSHHLIVSGAENGSQPSEMWVAGNVAEGLFGGVSLPGAQRVDENVPQSFEKPPEDAGLYTVFSANNQVTYDMHYFNPTDEILLREVWQNYWVEEDAQVRVAPMFGLALGQTLATFAQPDQVVDDHYFFPIDREIRLIMLFGHSHVWTSNFSAWLERADGTEEVLYQSFDWFDKPSYRYDSVTANPEPDATRLVDGAVSGIQMMQAGDELHFNCHMEYTRERAAATDSPVQPSTNGPLRFANQAYKGEMCILFGSTTSFLGTPAVATSPVPDFAQAD